MWRWALLYLVFVNLVTFGLFWLDKRRAHKGEWRVRERELLGWALVGGTPAALLAIHRLRHKSRSLFRFQIYGVGILQAMLLWFLL